MGLVCLAGLFLVGVKLARANVDLSGPVTAESVADGITIRWKTASETDTKLFHLLRSTAEKGPFQSVPICIRDNKDGGAIGNEAFAQGDIAGFSYEVTDLAVDLDSNDQQYNDLVNGQTYYYLLVEKETNAYKPYPENIAVVTYSFTNGQPQPSTRTCPSQIDLPDFDPVPLPTASVTTTLTVTATTTATATLSVTPSLTPTTTATITPTTTVTVTPTATITPTASLTPTPSWTPSETPSLTPIPATTVPTSVVFTSTPTFTPIPGSYPGNDDPTPTETPFGEDQVTPDVTETPLPEEETTPTPLAEAETPTETPTETPAEPTLTPIPEQPTAETASETATPTPSPTITPTPTLTPTRTPVAVAKLLPPPRTTSLSAAQVQVIGQPPAQAKRFAADLGNFVAALAGLGIFFLALALWQMFRRSV